MSHRGSMFDQCRHTFHTSIIYSNMQRTVACLVSANVVDKKYQLKHEMQLRNSPAVDICFVLQQTSQNVMGNVVCALTEEQQCIIDGLTHGCWILLFALHQSFQNHIQGTRDETSFCAQRKHSQHLLRNSNEED